MSSKVRNQHIEQYNEAYFQQGVEKQEKTLVRYLELLRSFLSPSATILDIGCGSGRLVKLLKRQGFTRIFGIDIALSALKSSEVEKLNLTLASAEEGLPFASESFDVIFFLDVIEHLRQPFEALQEIYRVLKPDGVLLLTTPNAGSILRPLLGKRWYALRDETHLLYFDSFSLLYLLSKTDFLTEEKFTYSGLDLTGLNFILEKTQQGGQLVVRARKNGNSVLNEE